ncbi:MAG: DUF1972 domain-containing protein [Streptococcus thermophilus]
MGGQFYINPDGLEWKRAKGPRQSKPISSILKNHDASVADLVISDGPGIESYIKESILDPRLYSLWHGFISDQPDQSG